MITSAVNKTAQIDTKVTMILIYIGFFISYILCLLILRIRVTSRYANIPAARPVITYPKKTGKAIFRLETFNSDPQEKSEISPSHPALIVCGFIPNINDPIFTENTNVTRLSQVLVMMLPSKALARLTLRKVASTKEAIGPVPGRIPKNTPRPNPKDIFWGESLILKTLWYINLSDRKILLPFGILFVFEQAF